MPDRQGEAGTRRFVTDHPAVGKDYTCDACSENERPIAYVEVETEAYICQACANHREKAENAGAVALAHALGHTLARIGLGGEDIAEAQAAPNTLRIARLVIDAYEVHAFGSRSET